MLGRVQAGIRVVLQEFQEIVALDEIELAGLQRFCGQFVRLAGNGSVKAENLASLRDTQNEGLAVARSGRELHPPAANDVNTARRLALNKQNGALRECAGVLDPLETFERRFRKIAEKTGVAKLTNQTALGNLQAIRRTHSELHV
jgi:hypothetical protein